MELSRKMKKTTIFITHDLDEAIRIGDRIAIMKDGIIVQTGTPEEIITHPADDYVADFIAGISRLKLVHAGSIMQPLSEWLSQAPSTDITRAPRAPQSTDLDQLIDISVSGQGAVIITDDAGTDIGVVDNSRLLRGIQGGK